jgi:hypothetical protein
VQASVPILPRPVVEDAESTVGTEDLIVRFEPFDSLVRLYRLDDHPSIAREWLNFPSGLLELVGGGTDGEFKVALMGGRVLSRLLDGGSIDSMVKSRSQVVEELAQFETERRRERVIEWLDPDSPCPVVIHAYDGAVGFFVNEVTPSFREGLGVGLCARVTA